MTIVLDGVAVTLAAGDRDSAVASSVVLDLRPSQQLSNDPDSMSPSSARTWVISLTLPRW
jgi:hypothetical protein